MEDLVLEPIVPARFSWGDIFKRILICFLLSVSMSFFDSLRHHVSFSWIESGCLFTVFCVITYFGKSPRKLTLSLLTRTLTYEYVNGLGLYRIQIVDFNKNVSYDYKYASAGRGKREWRLRVFNNYLTSRIEVSVTESEHSFIKEQLDELDATITRLTIHK